MITEGTNTRLIRQQDFKEGLWMSFLVDFKSTDSMWNFDIFWTGVTSIDASIIRIKKATIAI
jgi:hypothetical protein